MQRPGEKPGRFHFHATRTPTFVTGMLRAVPLAASNPPQSSQPIPEADRMRRVLEIAVLLAVSCGVARAQVGLYAAYGASDFRQPTVNWRYGPMAGLYWNALGVPFIKAGVDLRGSWIGSGSAQDDSYLLGPRVQLHPHIVPLMPYAEALGGVSRVVIGQGTARTAGTKFSYALVGGLDATIFPHLDWRVVDYSWERVDGLGIRFNPEQISTGLVVRLP